jgi:hypothetical protein
MPKKGWEREPGRHALAAIGVKTKTVAQKHQHQPMQVVFFDQLNREQKRRQVIIDALECFRDDLKKGHEESDNSGYDGILYEEEEILDQELKKLKSKQPRGVRHFWED